MTESSHGALGGFVAALASGSIRVVDLTQTLSSAFPTIELAAHYGQARPFKLEQISRYDERGPNWYWNNFCCSEHSGTHFDAPIHWITGRDLPNNAVDTVAVQDFIAPACVIDCSRQAAADPDYLMTVADIENHEKLHGRIPQGWWVLMRTDWSKRTDPKAFVNRDHTGQHTPGPSEEAVRLLVHDRKVMGFGTESISTDAGMAGSFPAPHPCHSLVHGAGRHGLQCLTNLDQLPARGAVIVCPPLKIVNGSGSPVRVLALVEGAAGTSR
ncbi:MAG: cyclase family protein [Caldimonas sp.]